MTESNIVHVNNARLAFADIFVPRENTGEDGKVRKSYGCKLILAPGHPAIDQVKRAIVVAAKAKWNEKAADMLKLLTANHKVCLLSGDLKTWDGFAGNQFVSAGSPTRPTIVDQDRTPLTVDDGRPYSGCYVNAIIEVWAQDNKYGKRINAQLKGVQFYRHGDAFGGGTPASPDEFQDVSAEGADAAAPATAEDDFSKFM